MDEATVDRVREMGRSLEGKAREVGGLVRGDRAQWSVTEV